MASAPSSATTQPDVDLPQRPAVAADSSSNNNVSDPSSPPSSPPSKPLTLVATTATEPRSCDMALTTSSLVKADQPHPAKTDSYYEQLRLPSFAALGISTHRQHLDNAAVIPLITPPLEDSIYSWSGPPSALSSHLGLVSLSKGTDSRKSSLQQSDAAESAPLSQGTLGQASVLLGPDNEHDWFISALSAIKDSTEHTQMAKRPMLRILSHALPTPTLPGHTYPVLLDFLKTGIPRTHILWISLMHAVPRAGFSLEQIPSSPPSTPGPAVGGDDYFSTTIFDSAISAADYDQGSAVQSASCSLVPPGSIDISIVERYIPPTNIHEFSALFNPTGPSLLADRLKELSPEGGCVAFVYPTRKGGRMFADDFLSPVLDPVLRKLTVLNEFSSDFSHTIGHMAALDQLLDFDTMRSQTQELCLAMSRTELSSPTFVTGVPAGSNSRFEIAHAARRTVPVPRDVLSTWWVKQEKPRIRAAVADFVSRKHKHLRIERRWAATAGLPSQEPVGAGIVSSLIDEVIANTSRAPEFVDIEVAVLVLCRSQFPSL